MYDQPRTATQSGSDSIGTTIVYPPKSFSDQVAGQPPRAEIASFLAEQEKMTFALNEALDLLESKLMPVTSPSIPEPTPSNGPGLQPASVPVAGCITENTARIVRAISRVESLRHRIAL